MAASLPCVLITSGNPLSGRPWDGAQGGQAVVAGGGIEEPGARARPSPACAGK